MSMEDKNYWLNRPKNDERKDWRNGASDWIEEYKESKSHPHRQLIVNAFTQIGGESLFEVGCNCGPNIAYAREKLPYLKDNNLGGIDANNEAIKAAEQWMPACSWYWGDAEELPLPDKSYDVVLADACFMYIGPDEIGKAIDEIDRVAKKGIIIVDWHDESLWGIEKNHHWARNYPKLLETKGFKVNTIKLTEKEWPNASWIQNGNLFIAQRA